MDRAERLTDRQDLFGHRLPMLDDDTLADVLFLQERARLAEAKAELFRRSANLLIEKMAGDGFAPAPDAAG